MNRRGGEIIEPVRELASGFAKFQIAPDES